MKLTLRGTNNILIASSLILIASGVLIRQILRNHDALETTATVLWFCVPHIVIYLLYRFSLYLKRNSHIPFLILNLPFLIISVMSFILALDKASTFKAKTTYGAGSAFPDMDLLYPLLQLIILVFISIWYLVIWYRQRNS